MISLFRDFLNYLQPKGGSSHALILDASGPSQRPILLRRQPQVASTPTDLNSVIQHLPALRGLPGFPAARQLPDLLRVFECELPEQRGLRIGLEELNLPT
jgi:hypothetical protein